MLFFIQLLIDSLFAFFLSSLIHELGHLITASCYGWNFMYMVAGPLRIEKRSNDSKLCISFERSISLWGGVNCSMPQNSNQKSFKEFSTILLFGPLLSIVMGTLLIPIFILTNSYLVLLTLCMSYGMGIICILPLPLRTGISYTDGYRYYRIKRKSSIAYNDEYILFKLSTISYLNPQISYDELKEIMSSLPLSDDPIVQFYLHYILLQSAAESSEIEKQTNEIEIINNFIHKVPRYILKACPIAQYDHKNNPE